MIDAEQTEGALPSLPALVRAFNAIAVSDETGYKILPEGQLLKAGLAPACRLSCT